MIKSVVFIVLKITSMLNGVIFARHDGVDDVTS